MKNAFLIVFGLVLLGLAMALVAKSKKLSDSKKGTFTRRPIATANEQGMFWRLVECFPQPEYVVLVQVSFGALLEAKDGASRYSFSQKRADFILADKSFNVLAVIELDDSSHRGNEDHDAQRDAMLMQAGYRVLRYLKTPDRQKLISDVNAKK